MTKFILFALVSVAGSAVCADSALACGRQACCATSSACVAPSCGVPAAGATADPHAGMQMPQANRGTSYQSFSYEPGAAPQMQPAPMQSGPAYRPMMRQSSPSFYDSVRGDRKIRGQY